MGDPPEVKKTRSQIPELRKKIYYSFLWSERARARLASAANTLRCQVVVQWMRLIETKRMSYSGALCVFEHIGLRGFESGGKLKKYFSNLKFWFLRDIFAREWSGATPLVLVDASRNGAYTSTS